MIIRILAVGKPTPFAYQEILSTYEKRLTPFHRVEWRFVDGSPQTQPAVAKTEETTRILQAIDKTNYVILLDERGVEYTSIQLEQQYEQWIAAHGTAVFVIGGAHGVAQMLFDRADSVWSLSKLVFPHQLMRILLMEQLYRSQMIKIGHPYHHS